MSEDTPTSTPTARQPAAPGDEKPSIAVIMPVLNEARYIENTLEQLAAQTYPKSRLEVIVADGGSKDGTPELARKYTDRLPGLKVVDNPGGGPASGRNVGIKNSTAPYIVVIDGHVHIPTKTLLADMVETFERTGAACLCRPQPLDPPDINLFQLAVARARASFLGHNPSSDIYSNVEKETDPTSSGAMWKREVYDQLGLYDEAFNACEDVELNFRIKQSGLKSWLAPNLKLYYYPRDSLRGLWRQMVRYGAGRYSFARKHHQFSLTQLVAPLGVLWFSLMALLTILGTGAGTAFGAVVNLYFTIVLLVSALIALREKQPAFIFSLPVIFPVIHFGLGWGFWKGWLKSRMSDNAPKPLPRNPKPVKSAAPPTDATTTRPTPSIAQSKEELKAAKEAARAAKAQASAAAKAKKVAAKAEKAARRAEKLAAKASEAAAKITPPPPIPPDVGEDESE